MPRREDPRIMTIEVTEQPESGQPGYRRFCRYRVLDITDTTDEEELSVLRANRVHGILIKGDFPATVGQRLRIRRESPGSVRYEVRVI